MSAARNDLLARRTLLLERISTQRREFGVALGVLRQPLAFADLAWSVARFTRRHPLAILCGVGLLRSLAPLPLLRIARWWQRGRHLVAVLRLRL